MRLSHAHRAAVVTLGVALLAAAPALATTRTVTQLGDDGAGSLREALAIARPGDRIVFALAGTIALASELVIHRSVSVDATALGGVTLIGSGCKHRLVRIEPGAFVRLRGLTFLQDCPGGNYGDGAVWNGGTLLLAESDVLGNPENSYGFRSAIFNGGFLLVRRSRLADNPGTAIENLGLLQITDSTLEQTGRDCCRTGLRNEGYASILRSVLRYSVHSGGRDRAAIRSEGSLRVADSEIQPNVEILDGAAHFVRTRFLPAVGEGRSGVRNRGDLLIADSELDGQTAMGWVALENSGTARVVRSSIAGNRGGYGLDNSGWLDLENVTLSGTRSVQPPGAALANTGFLRLLHTTVTQSQARIALYNRGTVVARNSLIASQSPSLVASFQDCLDEGTLVSEGGNLDSDGTCGFEITADPLLGPLGYHDGTSRSHAPLPGSPALDAVDCFLRVDQRGVLRPMDGDGDGDAACDIGAHERFRPRPLGRSQRGKRGWRTTGTSD